MRTSAHLKLALAWITYTNTGDVNKMSPILSNGFLDQIRPASLNISDLGKQPFLDRMKISNIHYNISLPKDEDIVETKDVVMFYTTANGHTEHGFPWINEYIFKFTFDGEKIASVSEFTDAIVVTTAISKEAVVAEAKIDCKN